MEKTIELFLQIMRKTAIPFMVCSVFLNGVGYLNGVEVMKVSSLYQPQGITFEGVFQLFLLSLFVGFLNTVFDTKTFMKNTLPLYKDILRISLVLVVTTCFAWYFRWFEMDNIYAWVGFIIAFAICIIISVSLSVYITHKKNKEYELLLKKYKERGQAHEGNSN